VIDDLRLPHFLAGRRVERDQRAVEPSHEDAPVGVGDPAVVDVAAGVLIDAGRDLRRVPPAHDAGLGVHGEDVLRTVRRRHVERVADDERRGLLGPERASWSTHATLRFFTLPGLIWVRVL